MPANLTARLDTDEEFSKKILKVSKDYIENAKTVLDYYSPDFDAAHDTLMCYASLSKSDYVKLAKGHPKRFILPITATHVHTMTTVIAATLFGNDAPYKVEAGSGEDEARTRVVNGLLRWNAEVQPEGMYQLGSMWVENALVYNRGVFYDNYEGMYKSQWQEFQEPELDEAGMPVVDPMTLQPKVKITAKKVKVKTGSFCRVQIVSPYDFFVDPMVPLYRMQSGRFVGHRFPVTWIELQRRSKLDPEDPMFVSPKAVENLKKKTARGIIYPTASTGTSGSTADGAILSRTAYERGKLSGSADARVNSKDAGVIEGTELWVKLVPKDYDIDERTDAETFQIIVGNDQEPLAVNESTYEHDMYPYSIGEARPSPFYQFAPSWVMILKNIQDYVDYLKNRHQEAVARTIGNVFMAKSHLIDIKDFEDPDKEGKFISILPAAEGMDINNIIKQVPVVDTTANFLNEMNGFIGFAESTSGASQGMQGQATGDGTATEFAGSMQMGQGRLAHIARLLSVQGLVPQTKRFVSNFQQFLDTELVRRIEGEDLLDMEEGQPTEVQISQDAIQGSFDYRPHDGTLPGPDGKKVAALTRALDSSMKFPGVFIPGPGNLDPRRILLDIFRTTGMNVERYRYRPEQLAVMIPQMQAAAANGIIPGGPGPNPNGPGPTADNPPGPKPENPNLDLAPPPSAEPPAVRPSNV